MTGSTFFLLLIMRQTPQLCYSTTKAGKAEASHAVRIRNVLDTIKTQDVITMALSKETFLGKNKDLGSEKVNTKNSDTAAGGLNSLTTGCWEGLKKGFRCHCVNTVCV